MQFEMVEEYVWLFDFPIQPLTRCLFYTGWTGWGGRRKRQSGAGGLSTERSDGLRLDDRMERWGKHTHVFRGISIQGGQSFHVFALQSFFIRTSKARCFGHIWSNIKPWFDFKDLFYVSNFRESDVKHSFASPLKTIYSWDFSFPPRGGGIDPLLSHSSPTPDAPFIPLRWGGRNFEIASPPR